jgi:hypothetical protein
MYILTLWMYPYLEVVIAKETIIIVHLLFVKVIQ